MAPASASTADYGENGITPLFPTRSDSISLGPAGERRTTDQGPGVRGQKHLQSIRRCRAGADAVRDVADVVNGAPWSHPCRETSNGSSELSSHSRLFSFSLSPIPETWCQPIYSPQERHTVCLRRTHRSHAFTAPSPAGSLSPNCSAEFLCPTGPTLTRTLTVGTAPTTNTIFRRG